MKRTVACLLTLLLLVTLISCSFGQGAGEEGESTEKGVSSHTVSDEAADDPEAPSDNEGNSESDAEEEDGSTEEQEETTDSDLAEEESSSAESVSDESEEVGTDGEDPLPGGAVTLPKDEF